jgi:hypothetical protein
LQGLVRISHREQVGFKNFGELAPAPGSSRASIR